ncbi:MAG: hypothetical protein M1829_006493 [Trizodia sp. TS-e1964]|nr:MAG: hypothetical protein M1829_006493 [Trizodia sp. TS-e1964]
MPSEPAGSSKASAAVKRSLFSNHLTRRPTSSAYPPTPAAHPSPPPEQPNSEIVIRDKDGNFQVQLPMMSIEKRDEDIEKEKEDARLAEAIKHHCRDRNREPSEPAGEQPVEIEVIDPRLATKYDTTAELLAAVQASLKEKVASLQDDNWMYEAEVNP